MKNQLVKSTSALLFTLTMGMNAHANMIVNGSFEDLSGSMNLDRNSWMVFDDITGWDTVSGPGIEIQTNSTLGKANAQDGNNYVELDSHGGSDTNAAMSQLLTGLTVGSIYELNFYYHARTNKDGNDNGINVFWDEWLGTDLTAFTYTDELLSIDDVKFNDTIVDGATPVNGGWFQFNIELQATASSMALTFGADGKDNSLGGFIDNVSLYSVPEPGTLGLFSLGVVGLLVARKRN